MGYEYFYQNIAEWLLLSMLIFIDSSLQILILDNFFLIFFQCSPYSRDPKRNRPNVVGKDEDYCCSRCVNTYELMLAMLFRGGVFDRVATKLCGSDAVTDPVTGWSWRIISGYQGEMANCGNGTTTTMATRQRQQQQQRRRQCRRWWQQMQMMRLFANIRIDSD